MDNRPAINNKLSGQVFRSYYYLKEELTTFCRQEGLQTSGGKIDLTNRIAHYLDTGEKLISDSPSRINTKTAKDIVAITEDSLIERHFVCSEKHRAFFKQAIGKSFSFPVAFQNWLKQNTGKTYRDAINAYAQILEDKKKNKTIINKQFEYNTYIRDFFADNPGKSLEVAISCWKYKKGLQGPVRYERNDLEGLK